MRKNQAGKLLLERLIQKEKNTPLNGKVAIIIIFIVLLPLALISGVLFSVIQKNTIESEEYFRITSLTNVKDNVDSLLRDYEQSIDTIYNYPELLKMSSQEGVLSASMDEDNRIQMILARVRASRGYVGAFSLIFPDQSSLVSISGYGNFEEFIRENERQMVDFVEEMNTPKQSIVWEANPNIRKSQGKAAYFISGRKAIRNIYHQNDLIGLGVMHVSTLSFEDVTSLHQNNTQEMLAILDGSSQLVWYNQETELDLSLLDSKLLSGLQENEPMKLLEYEDHTGSYCYLYETSEYSDWVFVNIIPKDMIYTQVTVFKIYFGIVVFFLCLFALFCGIMINRQMVRPIQAMIVVMDHIDELDKIGQQLSTDRSDEIGGLYRAFGQMSERINFLIGQLKEAYSQDKEKEIKLIQSQLNPHFIYNTLESISWVAYDKDLPEVSKALTCLSSILRYSIKDSGEYVTFEEEFHQLKQYLYIQHFRFEEKFSVSYHIDASLLQFKTIKFIFQPFVENALLHAFQNQLDDCRIDLAMKEQDGDILIAVRDNGCGIPPEMMEQIMGKDSRGIGIKNINKTLKLRFGDEYHLWIESKVGIGTCVYLRVPKVR